MPAFQSLLVQVVNLFNLLLITLKLFRNCLMGSFKNSLETVQPVSISSRIKMAIKPSHGTTSSISCMFHLSLPALLSYC